MEEDRISQLCDDILLLILDKMDIFEAVDTTLLSNRWKNLWRLLPGLRFHLSLHPRHCCLNLKNSTIRSDFVSQFLSRRDAAAAVRDFHLSFDGRETYSYEVDRELVEECLLYAINHGVQSLRLHAPTKHRLRLPAAFLTCETLRELELRQLRSSVKVPGRLSLPNLKTFHLETPLVFDDDDISMEPFSGLPELAKLTLIKYSWDGLVIKAPKLRVLEIIDFYEVEEISAPLLTSFRYESAVAWECANVDLPLLEQVYLDIYEIRYSLNKIHSNFVRMLHQFGNATTVSLTLDTLKVLEHNGDPFEQSHPPFPNMKYLKVMKGRNGIRVVFEGAVFQGVMNYLTRTVYGKVKLSLGVVVVEHISNEDEDNYGKYAEFDLYSDYSDGDEDIEYYDYSDGDNSDGDEDIEFSNQLV